MEHEPKTTEKENKINEVGKPPSLGVIKNIDLKSEQEKDYVIKGIRNALERTSSLENYSKNEVYRCELFF